MPGDSSRDLFGMVSSRDPFQWLSDLQGLGMKFGHGFNQSPGGRELLGQRSRLPTFSKIFGPRNHV